MASWSLVNRCVTSMAVAAAVNGSASAAFVGYVVTSVNVTNSGQNLTVYTVAARFNGATDTLLNCFNLSSTSGSSALSGFWNKDNESLSSGVLTQSGGSWNPTLTGSATANRPYDSYLTIGGQASATNTSSADPSWNNGGNTDARGWNRPDLPNNGTLGWYNSSPPTLQGRVGNSPGLPATDVRIAQFVLSTNDSTPRTFQLTSAYNNGVVGTPVQFVTASFTLTAGGCPTLYRDLDGDGFGSAASGTITSCSPVNGYVASSTDCNDNNAAINPNTLWYPDTDGDGYGSSASGNPVASCVQPSGYAFTNNDCNDANAAINPATVWHRDADNDGYGAATGSTVTQCAQPTGYVLSSTDCNDNNAAINPNTSWYRDTDGDGLGVAAEGVIHQCTQPSGYALINGDNCATVSNPDQADVNNNGIGDACEYARGDLNLDGVVNASDLPLLFNAWGSPNPTIGDLNQDGFVNAQDFALLLGNWGSHA